MDAASEPTWMYSRRLQNNVMSAYFKLRGIETPAFRGNSGIYPSIIHYSLLFMCFIPIISRANMDDNGNG